MCRVAIVALICVLLCPLKGRGQQPTSAQSSQAVFPAQRDPQAVSIASQSLALAGGSVAFLAISDYTAAGTIISSQGQSAQDTVTISGRGANELRKDTTDSTGTSTSIMSDVVTITKNPSGDIEARSIQPPMMAGNVVLPYREMAMVIGNPQFSLVYVGVVQMGAISLHDIRAQFVPGKLHVYQTVDFLVDVSTLQLRMIQDALPRHAMPRTIAYADFRTIGGVAVPFQITETIAGQPISTTQLSQITLNVGLQDSTFQISSAVQ